MSYEMKKVDEKIPIKMREKKLKLFQNSNKRKKKEFEKTTCKRLASLGEKQKILGYLQIEEERRERERGAGGAGRGPRARARFEG
jgi:hypothetical protein